MSSDGRSWRKLQRLERASHRLWPVMARAIRDHLLRLPDDLDGVIFESTTDPVGDLLQALGAHKTERKVVADAIRFLLGDGYLVHKSGRLSIKNFEKEQADEVDKKRSDAAERQRRKRERDRLAKEQASDAAQPEARDDVTDDRVTSRVTVTQRENVTSRAIRREEKRGEESVTRDDVTRDGQPPPPPPPDPDRETMCPTQLALSTDVRSELAGRLKVAVADIEAAEHEFVTYWTIGGGAGKRRRNWVARLRQDVCEKSKRGQLAGLAKADGDAKTAEQRELEAMWVT